MHRSRSYAAPRATLPTWGALILFGVSLYLIMPSVHLPTSDVQRAVAAYQAYLATQSGLVVVPVGNGRLTVHWGHAPGITGVAVPVKVDPVAIEGDPNDMALLHAPTMSAADIDGVLQQYGSPATGSGKDFYDLGVQSKIDPAYALAFFIHESSAGTNPAWAGNKGNGQTTHNIGNIECAGYATCYGRFRDYPDWRTGIEDWYRLMTDLYIPEGRTTVEKVIPKYAPSFENDVGNYTNVVSSTVAAWRKAKVKVTTAPNVAQSGTTKHAVTDTGVIGDGFSATNPVWNFQARSMHWGTDYLGREGDKVYAPFDLTIIKLGAYGPGPTMGQYVQGTFDDGYVFYAGHLKDRPQFSIGQRIPAGTVLGHMNSLNHSHIQLGPPGVTGACAMDGTCVDFEQYEKEH